MSQLLVLPCICVRKSSIERETNREHSKIMKTIKKTHNMYFTCSYKTYNREKKNGTGKLWRSYEFTAPLGRCATTSRFTLTAVALSVTTLRPHWKLFAGDGYARIGAVRWWWWIQRENHEESEDEMSEIRLLKTDFRIETWGKIHMQHGMDAHIQTVQYMCSHGGSVGSS